MPAKAGIHLRFCCRAKKTWISGPGSSPGQALRRTDEGKSRLRVDDFRIPRLITEDCLISFVIAAIINSIRIELDSLKDCAKDKCVISISDDMHDMDTR